jgi:hypothetical protein
MILPCILVTRQRHILNTITTTTAAGSTTTTTTTTSAAAAAADTVTATCTARIT